MNKFRSILCLALAALTVACRTFDPEGLQQESALRVSLVNVFADIAGTKATPAELGQPSACDFNVKVVRNSNGAVVYNLLLGDGAALVKVAADEPYTVIASYGDNDLLAMNKPYYIGMEVAEVEAEQTKNVEIECKVGNSLISARFGSDETGAERFGKYFSECSLDVFAGDFVVSLPMGAEGMSAYLRSGSDYGVAFSGIMKETGERRSFDLPSDMIPATLDAAEHLIITLDLKVETGVDISVSKAEVVEVGVEQTIPFSWLPLPSFTSSHVFDSNGVLCGTDLECSASYPGCEWTAYVRNSAGTLVRTLSGEGALTSSWTASSDWPYLPSGTYTATFSYQYEGQTVNIEGRSKTFTVASPTGLKAGASGYTSYDRYKAGEISAANQCEPFKLYDIAVTLGLSDAIKANTNYSGLISSTSGSVWVDDNTGRKNFTGLSLGAFNSLSAGNHSCNVSLNFDGASATASFGFLISGLPVSFSPPTKAAGWYETEGTISWEGNCVKLGQWAWNNPHVIKYDKVFVPMGTKVVSSYNAIAMTGTVETTFKLIFGSNEILNSKTNNKDIEFNGSSTFISGSDAKFIEVSSSWGSGATGAVVYSLSFLYAQ